jgi:hypothetical protein
MRWPNRVVLFVSLSWLTCCSSSSDTSACGLNLGGLPVPECKGGTAFSPAACSDLLAANFDWFLDGLTAADLLDPNDRTLRELTAVLPIGQMKALRVHAGSIATAPNADCSGKASSVEWVVSNPAVARVETGADPRQGVVVGLSPGDTQLYANLTFSDGSPGIRALPFVFTNVGSGIVTVLRIVP